MSEDEDAFSDDANIEPSYGKRIKLEIHESPNRNTHHHHDFPRDASFDEGLHSHFCKDPNVLPKPAVIFDDGRGVSEEICYSTLDAAANFIKEFIESEVDEGAKFIGVYCKLNTLYPALILGILQSGKAFYNIDSKNLEAAINDGIKHLKMKCILGDFELAHEFEKNLNRTDGSQRNVPIPNTKFHFVFYSILVPEIGNVQSLDNRLLPEYSGKFCYAIQTSGTTGNRKTVLVPHSCICPNIKDFIQSWKVSSEDVIFGCAPPTFDPHVVELFVSLGSGATIVYTTPEVKLNGSQLSGVVCRNSVSIMQITPSLFRRLSPFLNVQSMSLRLVAFGGEKCPTKSELAEMCQSWGSLKTVNFQNVYGVTEVSCWASVGTIDLNSSCAITIGEGLSETKVDLVDVTDGEGEIVIRSNSRFCMILNENGKVEESGCDYRTGDLGKICEDGIIFLGRMDRVIKRNGMKVPLYVIEEMALSTGLISYAECVLNEDKLFLVVKLKEDCEGLLLSNNAETPNLMPALSCKLDLPLFMHPDYIIPISSRNYCVNSNGKIDFVSIIKNFLNTGKFIENHFSISKELIIKTLGPVWRSCTYPNLRPTKEMLQENFICVGGDSVSAARFVENTFFALKLFGSEIHQKYEQDLLKTLFEGTFESVVRILHDLINTQTSATTKITSTESDLLSTCQEKLSYPVKLADSQNHFEFELLYKFFEENESIFRDDDEEYVAHQSQKSSNVELISLPLQLLNSFEIQLSLCVDASPAVVKGRSFSRGRVICGCHGGILICIDLNILDKNPPSCHDSISWKLKLPNRIESTAVVDDEGLYVYVGCHDGKLYKISVSNGDTTCYARTLTQAAIRSQAVLSDDNYLAVFCDSANIIYGVDSSDLNIRWVQRSYRILATTTPVIFKQLCYISTLDKGVVALDLNSGNEVWSCGPKGVRYSSPMILTKFRGHSENDSDNLCRKRETVILCGTNDPTSEALEARNAKKGNIVWKYSSPFPITTFSSFPLVVSDNCYGKLLWISSTRKILVFGLTDGFYELCQEIENLVENSVTHPIILNCSSSLSQNECFVFLTVSQMSIFILLRLHSRKMEIIKPWFMPGNFETFSKPVQYNNFVLYGGRDNKLHIVKCASHKM